MRFKQVAANDGSNEAIPVTVDMTPSSLQEPVPLLPQPVRRREPTFEVSVVVDWLLGAALHSELSKTTHEIRDAVRNAVAHLLRATGLLRAPSTNDVVVTIIPKLTPGASTLPVTSLLTLPLALEQEMGGGGYAPYYEWRKARRRLRRPLSVLSLEIRTRVVGARGFGDMLLRSWERVVADIPRLVRDVKQVLRKQNPTHAVLQFALSNQAFDATIQQRPRLRVLISSETKAAREDAVLRPPPSYPRFQEQKQSERGSLKPISRGSGSTKARVEDESGSESESESEGGKSEAVRMSVSLMGLTVDDFGAAEKATFANTIAAETGVSKSQVVVKSVAAHTGGSRRRRRRLLEQGAAGIDVKVVVQGLSAEKAGGVASDFNALDLTSVLKAAGLKVTSASGKALLDAGGPAGGPAGPKLAGDKWEGDLRQWAFLIPREFAEGTAKLVVNQSDLDDLDRMSNAHAKPAGNKNGTAGKAPSPIGVVGAGSKARLIKWNVSLPTDTFLTDTWIGNKTGNHSAHSEFLNQEGGASGAREVRMSVSLMGLTVSDFGAAAKTTFTSTIATEVRVSKKQVVITSVTAHTGGSFRRRRLLGQGGAAGVDVKVMVKNMTEEKADAVASSFNAWAKSPAVAAAAAAAAAALGNSLASGSETTTPPPPPPSLRPAATTTTRPPPAPPSRPVAATGSGPKDGSFDPSYEWQEVKDGQSVPPGLEITMDLGGKKGRAGNKGDTGGTGGKGGPTSVSDEASGKRARISDPWRLQLWLPSPARRFYRGDVGRSTTVGELCGRIMAMLGGGVAGASPPVHLVVKSTGQVLPPTQTVEEARVFHLSVDHDLEAVIGGGANRCTRGGGGC